MTNVYASPLLLPLPMRPIIVFPSYFHGGEWCLAARRSNFHTTEFEGTAASWGFWMRHRSCTSRKPKRPLQLSRVHLVHSHGTNVDLANASLASRVHSERARHDIDVTVPSDRMRWPSRDCRFENGIIGGSLLHPATHR